MRCEYCPDPFCRHRLTAGPCIVTIHKEIEIVNAPNTAPLDAGNLARTTDGLIVEELRIKFNPILRAASALVQAVEGYVCPKKGDKYVFRGEVLRKCNELKRLLNETE